MIGSDAIVVGENWISEHYFTTDAKSQSFQAQVLQRRKEWEAEAAEQRATPRSRFTEARQHLEVDLAGLDELANATGAEVDVAAAVEGLYDRLLDVLGITGHGFRVERSGPLSRVSLPQITEQAPLAVVYAHPVETVDEALAKDAATLLHPLALVEDDDEFTSAARLISALFVEDDSAELVVLLAGRWAVLAERERWAEGRYLAVNIQLVCERNDTKRGGEIDRMLTCLSAESIAPDADGALWWHGVLAESVKHTVGVSQDLRDGVRLSIEIIANEVVARRSAQGLEHLPAAEAQSLAKQALRFLYRILFLLYAEASPELGVLPAGATEYDQGYSLDRLRELVQVELATPPAQAGTHLYDSLGVLFRLVDAGHRPAGDDEAFEQGLTFNPLRADLFRPQATAHIDEVGLGNAALQQVLGHLLLSKEQRGRDRGFISYAELGINQLGAVYEGLMSYTGFFAETDLYEVAKNGDGSKGTWVVPVDRSSDISPADFVKRDDPVTGEPRPVLHPQGSFVFRLAGRERQQSASYYTPEVLTKFTVGQALEELLDQDGHTTPAAEILDLTVCEPALGSGAFAIEAVRQLAEQYLTRRQKELGRRIDPDDYPRRLQEVKAYLALHNVYGVDLNATAVELAEISLWLDTMVKDLSAPWFGLHLRRGNSLVGARRAVYTRRQVGDRSWLTAVPRDVPLTSLVEDIDNDVIGGEVRGAIHHFLLPADGWGAAADAKEAKELAPDATAALNRWRKSIKAKPTKTQLDDLAELAHRVEVLWQYAYQRLKVAEQEIRRSIPVWKAGELPVGGRVQRDAIEEALADADGAYRRLRRVMDAWTSFWFWPLTDTLTTVKVDGELTRVDPPTLAQWISGLQAILGRSPEVRKRGGADAPTLSAATGWDELGSAETAELGFAGAVGIDRARRDHLWLVVCERIADQQGFHHWELDFASVFARGGFDLQVGNPPWVRPDWEPVTAASEFEPQLILSAQDRSPGAIGELVRRASSVDRSRYIDQLSDTLGSREIASDQSSYSVLAGLRPDLYRCFMALCWRNSGSGGTAGLLHPETHFTDENASTLRHAAYRHLRRHWQFKNELRFFENDNHLSFGVHIYGPEKSEIEFMQAVHLYHPDVAQRSLVHDGAGPEPGFKDDAGAWDLRPHRSRILKVDDSVLKIWWQILETSGAFTGTRMVYSVNASTASVLSKLASSGRLGDLDLSHSLGWDQTAEEKRGRLVRHRGIPDRMEDVILQGPHLWVSNAYNKIPNPGMKSNRDYSAVDLEKLAASQSIVPTAYKRKMNRQVFDSAFSKWTVNGQDVPSYNFFRVAWRSMAAPTNERTLIPALIPPGPTYLTQSIYAAGLPSATPGRLAEVCAWMGSLVCDLLVRSAPKSSIPRSIVDRLPFVDSGGLSTELQLRVLRLNCLTEAYAPMWESAFREGFQQCRWTGGLTYPGRRDLGDVANQWTSETPLRTHADRRQALVEIDAMVALLAGLTPDELCTVYRTQFAVLRGYDRSEYLYDANGRLLPMSLIQAWRRSGDGLSECSRTVANQQGFRYTYELPFLTLDREADMRQAYAEFERRLAERS